MNKKIIKIFIIFVTSLILISVLLFVINYVLNWNYPGSKFFKKVFPAVISKHASISLRDFERLSSINQLLNPQRNIKGLAKDRLLKYEVAKQYACLNNDAFIKSDYFYYQAAIGAATKAELSNFGFESEREYQEYVVKPQIIEDCLRIIYNLNEADKSDQYQKAQSILAKSMGNISDFGNLAKSFSDDKESAVLEGDLGFITKNDILPEIWDAISVARPGEVIPEIIFSRYGYHILYLAEIGTKDGQKYYRVKQIQINTEGFENWFSEQSKKYKVIFIK